MKSAFWKRTKPFSLLVLFLIALPLTISLATSGKLQSILSLAQSPAKTLALNPGDNFSVNCSGDGLSINPVSRGEIDGDCTGAAPTPTNTPGATLTVTNPQLPTATPTPTSGGTGGTGGTGNVAVGKCGEPMDRWHPPVITQAYKDELRAYYTRIGQTFPHESMTVGCATEHEHGDAPPTWITDSACTWSGFKDTCNKYFVSYSGTMHGTPVSSSGVGENQYKHVSMKGFLGNFPEKEPNGQSNGKRTDVYFRLHWSTNPFERNANYHSTEVWAKDSSGNVSHWQHWNFMGQGLCVRRNPEQGCDTVRPQIFPITVDSVREGVGCEVWYSPEHRSSQGGNWVWGMGLVVCDPVARWSDIEGSGDGSPTKKALNLADPNDPMMNPQRWSLTGGLGVTRQMDSVAWYHPESSVSGGQLRGRLGQVFWATQFGIIVDGPNDPRCTQNHTARDGKSYKNICLDQYVSTTMKMVSFPGNVMPLKRYPSTGVKVPN